MTVNISLFQRIFVELQLKNYVNLKFVFGSVLHFTPIIISPSSAAVVVPTDEILLFFHSFHSLL